MGGLEHVPVDVMQAPCVWQASGAGQTTGEPGTHAPPEQEPAPWHRSVAGHATPLFGAYVHVPLALHVPVAM